MNAELKKLIDEIASQPTLSADETDSMMASAFKMAKTPEERKQAGEYLAKAISRRKRPDVDVKEMLGEMAEVLNLSYIAKRYFEKDRAWLYQRLNHTLVNGKPASFTESELKRLSDSLEEISNNIHQITVQLNSCSD